MSTASRRWYCLVASALLACGRAPDTEPAGAARAGSVKRIEIQAAVAERAGIRSAAIKREHLARIVLAPAEVEFDPDRTTHLRPLVEARIERVSATLGDRVQAGALLAVLRSVAAGESRAGVAQSEADLDLARANLRRQEELRSAGIGAERTHQEAVAAARRAEAGAQAARQRASVVGAHELRAPLGGTVIERHATIGESVGRDDVLFTISDLEHVWVVGHVYERDVGAIAANAATELTLEAYPDRKWTGRLAYVAGALEHETRTLPVRIELENPDGALRPALFGTLAIEAGAAEDTLAVPVDAVQRSGNEVLVFVQLEALAGVLRFEPRQISVGREIGRFVEIRSGVREGERIAVGGTFTLKGELLRDTLGEEE